MKCNVYFNDEGDAFIQDAKQLIRVPVMDVARLASLLLGHSTIMEDKGLSFDLFWKAYPKKSGKALCQKKWKALNPSKGLVEMILKSVSEQTKTEQWQQYAGKFIPMPATWLNQERWTDVLDVEISNVSEMIKSEW